MCSSNLEDKKNWVMDYFHPNVLQNNVDQSCYYNQFAITLPTELDDRIHSPRKLIHT